MFASVVVHTWDGPIPTRELGVSELQDMLLRSQKSVHILETYLGTGSSERSNEQGPGMTYQVWNLRV